jgi:hypothetical protein
MSPNGNGGSSTMSFRDLHTSTTSGSLSDMRAVNMNTTSTKSNNTQSPCNSLRSTASTSVAMTPASDGCISSITAIDSPNSFGSTRGKSVFFSDEQEHEHEHGENSNAGIRNDSDSSRTDDSTDMRTSSSTSTDNTYKASNSSVDVCAAVLQPSLSITGIYNPQHIRSSSSTLPR